MWVQPGSFDYPDQDAYFFSSTSLPAPSSFVTAAKSFPLFVAASFKAPGGRALMVSAPHNYHGLQVHQRETGQAPLVSSVWGICGRLRADGRRTATKGERGVSWLPKVGVRCLRVGGPPVSDVFVSGKGFGVVLHFGRTPLHVVKVLLFPAIHDDQGDRDQRELYRP